MKEKKCQRCANIHRRNSNFCSDNCRNKFNYKSRTSQTCIHCGKIARKLSNFCSNTCYKQFNYSPIVVINTCQYCDLSFNHSVKSSFCSTKCRSAFAYHKRKSNKVCTMCGRRHQVSGLTTCSACRESRKKYKGKQRPIKQAMLNSMRQRAKRKNIPINIKISDIIVPEFCPVLNIKLERGVGKTLPNSPSIDRFIPELGYTTGNIRVISHRANTIKQDAGIDEIEAVLNWMKTITEAEDA